MRIFIVFLFSIGILGCAAKLMQDSENDIPVAWEDGFSLPGLLGAFYVMTNVTDIAEMMGMQWYSEITVRDANAEESVLASCNDYFNRSRVAIRAKQDNEMGAFLEFTVMCEAARVLMVSERSAVSYLPRVVLSELSPRLWPKEFALQTSAEEARRTNQNSKLVSWDDVTPITKYISKSGSSAFFYHQGGFQQVEVIGRGDTNKDGVEDLMLSVRDHADGGSYFNMRLFVLSVDSQNNWHLLKTL